MADGHGSGMDAISRRSSGSENALRSCGGEVASGSLACAQGLRVSKASFTAAIKTEETIVLYRLSVPKARRPAKPAK